MGESAGRISESECVAQIRSGSETLVVQISPQSGMFASWRGWLSFTLIVTCYRLSDPRAR
jgi:hypothetical protein